MTTSTIGTGARTYASVTAWLAAFPGSVSWIGQVYPDTNPTVVSANISFSGHAVSAGAFIQLMCGAGQSFSDNSGAASNALAYNPSNGVAFTCSTPYVQVFNINEDFVTLTGLQVANTANSSSSYAFYYPNNTSHGVIESCIAENAGGGSAAAISMGGGTVRNCLAVSRNAQGNGIAVGYAGARVGNCTVVRPSDLAIGNNGFSVGNNNATLTNNAVFGFTNFASSTFVGDYNASDVAIAVGTHNKASQTYGSSNTGPTFMDTRDTTRDFRIFNASSCLVDNGSKDTTDIPGATDIIGTARPG